MARKAELWRATLPDVTTWRLRRDVLALTIRRCAGLGGRCAAVGHGAAGGDADPTGIGGIDAVTPILAKSSVQRVAASRWARSSSTACGTSTANGSIIDPLPLEGFYFETGFSSVRAWSIWSWA
jgi:hypothetical protein